MMVPDAHLEILRRQLLDLTMNNRLLNHRPSRSRTIPVTGGTAADLFDTLVLQEKTMRFRAMPTGGDDAGPETTASSREDRRTDIEPGRRPDLFLEVPLTDETLQQRLFAVHHAARTVLEEQGYSVLYLALAFLEYRDASSSIETARAPLILIPVEIERARVGERYALRWTGEEISHNLSLAAKLKEQSVGLPEFETPETKEGVDVYLNAVTAAVAGKRSWRVLDGRCLDFFSYTKFVMYKDLDPQTWPDGRSPAGHPLVRAVLDPSPAAAPAGFAEEDVDRRLAAKDVFHVVDADSSQIAAIEDVKGGANLVVEGPPGTGKSQTITNIIAESLALGKSVLFVSEKMAALDVVKSRLDAAGLGEFCLELHSRKSNKRRVIDELRRTVETDIAAPGSFGDELEALEARKAVLDRYVDALAEPIGARRLSPFDLFGINERVLRHFGSRSMPRVAMPDPRSWDVPQWQAAVSALGAIQDVLPAVRPIRQNPWRRCEPGILLPSDIGEIGESIAAIGDALAALAAAIERTAELAGASRPETPGGLARFLAAARLVAASRPFDRAVLENPSWSAEGAEPLVALVEAHAAQEQIVLPLFGDTVVDRDVAGLAAAFRQESSKFLRVLRSRYRASRREALALYRDPSGRDDATILADLDAAMRLRELRNELEAAGPAGRELFGPLWQGERSDPVLLREFAGWMRSFRQDLADGVLNDASIGIVASGAPAAELGRSIAETGGEYERLRTDVASLADRVGGNPDDLVGGSWDGTAFAPIAETMATLASSTDLLTRWSQYVAFRAACHETVAGSMIPSVEEDRIDPDDLLPAFEGTYAGEMLKVAFAERPELGQFVGDLHESRIRAFAQADRSSLAWNRCRLAARLAGNRPSIVGGASRESETGILLREFTKKRGHLPIRQLLSRAGSLIQQIKPCFMMSPLSIAQFLDPRSVSFDLVVFDEASQVRPEDAIGALLRGRQVVVMGDSRQLPPTTFFDRIAAADDEDEPDGPTDAESILDLCKRGFPRKMLRWHYRSRHETLIAVSNREFYDNRLLVYPSPVDRAEHLGLSAVHLPETTYDRGQSGANRGEAKAVAAAVIDHYRRAPEKSLMVGTFNIRQQEAIQIEVEALLREHPEIEAAMTAKAGERFAVKNLETIQGDERDVVFISVGFGFDEAGKLSLNFGPLNREGGERRLNVLVTRARERCVVFANFRARDLDADSVPSVGLRVLRQYLEYAETGRLPAAGTPQEEAESPFEEAVCEFLAGAGYKVRKQVGSVGFRIDLAVVDPDSPGRYLIGIECDGARYHSSKVARDRDRLRQQILEGLGWRIHRVWSPDWFRNRRACEERLVEAVERARAGGREPVPAAEEEPAPTIEKVRTDLPGQVADDPFGTLPMYRTCEACGLSRVEDFGTIGEDALVDAVGSIVAAEGPVHVDEVARRIRGTTGIPRNTKKVQERVKAALEAAAGRGTVVLKGPFAWPPGAPRDLVRRRDGSETVKAEYICDEEIAGAVAWILARQHGTAQDGLVAGTARLLGFRSVRESTGGRIGSVIESMIRRGELCRDESGTIRLPKLP